MTGSSVPRPQPACTPVGKSSHQRKLQPGWSRTGTTRPRPGWPTRHRRWKCEPCLGQVGLPGPAWPGYGMGWDQYCDGGARREWIPLTESWPRRLGGSG